MMMNGYNDFYTFSCDWETAETTRKLNLYFYPRDNSIELYDVCMKRILLKRTVTELSLNDIYLNATLTIFGKKIIVRQYGNPMTEQKLSKIKQRTFLMIKPEARQFIGEIISTLEKRKLYIRNLKMLKLQSLAAVQFLNQRKTPENKVSALMQNLTSGLITVLEITGENAYEQLKHICGPENFDEAKNNYPISLRALYGFDDIQCGVLLSDDYNMNLQDLEYFFPSMNDKLKVQAKFIKSTLCIIKPHAIKEGNIGAILKMIIENGFSITAMKMLNLSRSKCETFYELYKGVVDDYASMVLQLQSGACLAIEVQGNNDDGVQKAFRSLCGPSDPSIAKIIRPNTIRANFGTDKILNAVHCTDLSEDTLLEMEYIFKELD
ncbi:hypothetical protein PVAND_010922 [Polypedilum vanderplanki]|uniref:DM10 domain-containing protein n=1 Tax=Polypedilum vanderplanki TaxID=319348 RepID=A0A9J6CHH0_POLVA|nr:hypothetical protein PVAND_010922 [Polypedilum vanderplanki]